MQRIEYRTIDKESWGEGPWQSEPDKIQWQDEETGYPCLIHRAHKELGHLCGYVGVPPGHPAFNKDYDGVNADVHGGLTFAGPCQSVSDESHGICHKPEAGEPDHVYWLGFDCAHLMDYVPGMVAGVRARGSTTYGENDVYRDVGYVTAECQKLAKQLKAMEE